MRAVASPLAPMTDIAASAPLWRRWELPTWAVAAAIYGAWLAMTWHHAALPAWLLAPAGAVVLCWHGHLQHEALHGHPTRSRRVNELLVFLPLGMWFPYGVYRDTHLDHHRDIHLTSPLDDPESYYVTPSQWRRLPAFARALLRFNNTVLGRMTVGPALATRALYGGALRRLLAGHTADLKSWLLHGLGAAATVAWLVFVGFPFWLYAVMAYFGVSLIMLRSFAEHRPAEAIAHRICINDAERIMGLLYLNNSLHAVHHAMPGRAWYELPGEFRRNRELWLERNGGFLWNGYRDVIRRHFLRPKDEPVHPFIDEAGAARA